MKFRDLLRWSWWRREAHSIRARLLLVNAFLVVVPIAGVSFARTYERELLRTEEEGMAAVALTLAASLAEEPRGASVSASVQRAARAAAERLHAQVQVLDGAGRAVFDSGPELVEIQTEGRTLLPTSLDFRARRTVSATESRLGASGFSDRPEVRVALQGRPGRYTRRASNLRGVRLFVTEPVRGSPGVGVGAVVYVSRSSYPVLVSLYRVRNRLIKVAAISLGVSVVVALFLAFTIARPLRRLTEAAGRIANGERGVALDLEGRDEIGELARDFNAMARALDARLGYISELAANVSHEFKTPIASVQGAAELLRDGAADDPEARARFLGNILSDTDRLSRLVSRLLELSRIEARPEPRVPLDYRSLLEGVAARYRDSGDDVQLTWNAPNQHLRASPEQIEVALTNLLDNALRHSEPGAPVRVAVSGDEHEFHTAVRDQGAGISEANLARVWDRFFTTARAEGGTGLGLSIVRAIVESHGGVAGVDSSPTRGATFWFTLPRRL